MHTKHTFELKINLKDLQITDISVKRRAERKDKTAKDSREPVNEKTRFYLNYGKRVMQGIQKLAR